MEKQAKMTIFGRQVFIDRKMRFQGNVSCELIEIFYTERVMIFSKDCDLLANSYFMKI